MKYAILFIALLAGSLYAAEPATGNPRVFITDSSSWQTVGKGNGGARPQTPNLCDSIELDQLYPAPAAAWTGSVSPVEAVPVSQSQTQTANPEPVAPPVLQPPKLLIDPKQPQVMPYLKKCGDVVTVTAVEGTQQFGLDTAATHIKWSGTLYNTAGDEITTFKAVKTANFAEQICAYFNGLKVAQDKGIGR